MNASSDLLWKTVIPDPGTTKVPSTFESMGIKQLNEQGVELLVFIQLKFNFADSSRGSDHLRVKRGSPLRRGVASSPGVNCLLIFQINAIEASSPSKR